MIRQYINGINKYQVSEVASSGIFSSYNTVNSNRVQKSVFRNDNALSNNRGNVSLLLRTEEPEVNTAHSDIIVYDDIRQ